MTNKHNEYGLTQSQSDALVWLARNGASGVFMKWPQHNCLLAAGNVAPFMYSTWTRLQDKGMLVKQAKTVALTLQGSEVAVHLYAKGYSKVTGQEQPSRFEGDEDGET